jgi:hypothetical protein
MRMQGVDSNTKLPCEALVSAEFHIVDGLRANLLVGTDITVPHRMDILLSGKQMAIGACAVTVPIEVRPRPGISKQFQPVCVKSTTLVPPGSVVQVPIHSIPKVGRDFLFEPEQMDHLTLFAGIIDQTTHQILVKNTTSNPASLRRGTRIGRMHELDGEQGLIATAFTTEVDEMVELAEVAPRQRNERWFHETLALITKSQNPDTLSKPKALETVLPNGVTVYGLEGTLEVQQLADVVNSYPEIFQDSGGFVNIDQSEWMKIPLVVIVHSRSDADI